MEIESGVVNKDLSKLKKYSLMRSLIIQLQGFGIKTSFSRFTIIGSFGIFLLLYLISNSYSSVSNRRRGACVFDMSALINPADLSKYSHAEESMRLCINKNLEIAVIGQIENSGYDYDTKFLSLYFPEIWNENRINSLAHQIHTHLDMGRSLRLIMANFGLNPSCGVLISSKIHDEIESDRIGMGFVDVKIADGVLDTDMTTAFDYLESNCNPNGEKVLHACSDVPPDSQYTCARQKKWGKCSEPWMKDFCCYSCHDCSCGTYASATTTTITTTTTNTGTGAQSVDNHIDANAAASAPQDAIEKTGANESPELGTGAQ